VTQPDDLHPFRVEHLNFKPAVTSEWDLISVQLWQITALRCRVKNLEDALRDVSGELDVMIGHLIRDPRWDVDPRLNLKDSVIQMLHEAADTASNLLNPTTTIISDAEID
jgi:hypothetical protein